MTRGNIPGKKRGTQRRRFELAPRTIKAPPALEADVQRAICEFLDWSLPECAIVLTFAGGDRQATLAAGYKAGTPDLVVVYAGRAHFMELKRETGAKISQAQQDMAVRLLACGARHAFIYTPEEARAFLVAGGVPLKGRFD